MAEVEYNGIKNRLMEDVVYQDFIALSIKYVEELLELPRDDGTTKLTIAEKGKFLRIHRDSQPGKFLFHLHIFILIIF